MKRSRTAGSAALVLATLLGVSACGSSSGSSGSAASSEPAAATDAAAPASDAVTAVTEAAAPATDGPAIKLVQNSWTASAINVAVAKNIIEKNLGSKVEVVQIDENAQFKGLADGDVDATLEVWPSGVVADEQKYIDDKLVVNDGPLGVTGQIGWFTPDYVVEKYPSLKTWEGMKDPAVAKAFATAETGDKGRFLGTDPSFSQLDEPIIKNLGLPFQVQFSGSEAATTAELDSRVAAKEPIVMYWWTPTASVAKYKLKLVELPAYTDGCATDVKAVKCGYPADVLFKAESAKLAAKAPKVSAFLKKFSLTTDDQLSMLPAVELEKRPADEVAAEWLAAHESTWKAWLS